jgi:hypothetical protein
MSTRIGSAWLLAADTLGDCLGVLSPSEDCRFERCAESLPALQALEDGREITTGLSVGWRGCLSIGSTLQREPGPNEPLLKTARDEKCRMAVVRVLTDAGEFIRRIEQVAREQIDFHIGLTGGRQDNEPIPTEFEDRLLTKGFSAILARLNFSPKVRWQLKRLGVEFEMIFSRSKKEPTSAGHLRDEAQGIDWGSSSAGEFCPIEKDVCLPKLPSGSCASFGHYAFKRGLLRFQERRGWKADFQRALAWTGAQQIKEMLKTANTLRGERMQLRTELPFEALRRSLNGAPLSVNAKATLDQWIQNVRDQKKTEASLRPLLDALVIVMGIEGPRWKARARLANIFLPEKMVLSSIWPDSIEIRQDGRAVALDRHQAAETYCIFKPRAGQSGAGRYAYVFPRGTELERCRQLVRQSERPTDFPRATIWEPIAEGAWRIPANLVPLQTKLKAIQQPRTLEQSRIFQAWCLQVDAWREGRTLPSAFSASSIFCENSGDGSRVVWLTPESPKPFSPQRWEQLIQDVANWMGDEAYLHMAASLGWDTKNETELLSQVVDDSLRRPNRVLARLNSDQDASVGAWVAWLRQKAPQIRETMEAARRRSMDLLQARYVGASDGARYAEFERRINIQLLEEVKLLGPSVRLLAKAARRTPLLVARTCQLHLKQPLDAIKPLFEKAVVGLNPETLSFSRELDRCGVACEPDIRTTRHLFQIICQGTTEERGALAAVLTSRTAEISLEPAKLSRFLVSQQVRVRPELVEEVVRQISLMTRAGRIGPQRGGGALRI